MKFQYYEPACSTVDGKLVFHNLHASSWRHYSIQQKTQRWWVEFGMGMDLYDLEAMQKSGFGGSGFHADTRGDALQVTQMTLEDAGRSLNPKIRILTQWITADGRYRLQRPVEDPSGWHVRYHRRGMWWESLQPVQSIDDETFATRIGAITRCLEIDPPPKRARLLHQ